MSNVLNGTVLTPDEEIRGTVSAPDVLLGTVLNPDKVYGKSAYEIAVAHGFKGTEKAWLDSLAKDATTRAEESAAIAQNAATSASESKEIAQEAANTAVNTAVNAANTAVEAASVAKASMQIIASAEKNAVEAAAIAEEAANKVDIDADDFGIEQDKDTGYVYPVFKSVRSKNGIPLAAAGGGGGGGTATTIDFKVTNTSEWLVKTVAKDAECFVTLNWHSIDDGIATGNGTLKVTVNGVLKLTKAVQQGDVPVEIGKYLVADSNEVKVSITDMYGNNRAIVYTVSVIAANITSYFDPFRAYTGDIDFSYTAYGEIEKVVHFIVDGDEIGTETVTTSNRERTYTIPAQRHGNHTLEVYYDFTIDDEHIPSNHLYYEIICYEEGETDPIIATQFKETSVKQYASVVIPYMVYTPDSLTSVVQLKDGDTVVAERTVDRTRQTWVYKAVNEGTANLSIVCGDIVKPITFAVSETDISAEAEIDKLELHLTSENRDNGESDPLSWEYGDIKAELTGFNLKSDGWKGDDDGNTVLRVTGEARVYIPFNIFGRNFGTTGKSIEIEFATRDVLNYDAEVITAWSGEKGIKVTAQKALFKSEQSEISTQYKENEHVRIAFCVEKEAENRLLAIYINGIMSGVVQYPSGDNFAQDEPVGISIGSGECTTDIYCIRVYGKNLSRYQIVENWIADTQNVDEMIDRATRNEIFDAYGNIDITKLPANVPYLVVNASSYEQLPQSKGDKKIVSGRYVDPLHSDKGFTFMDAEIDVQGTSSADYSRKNYKIKFKGGFVYSNGASSTYKLSDASMPTNVFTFKADVASSEGANNVELVMLYDDVCPVKTPPQEVDSRVRQGIEGYPCLMFYYDGTNYRFIGKYNFNNDKATGEVFGFDEGDESWEILHNNSNMVIWKDDDFSGDAWKDSFEARYPEDNTNITNLQAFSSWLKSTDTTAVSTEEEKAARLDKFKREFADWCNVDAMIFNYIFTEMFLMVDNRAKNAFPTRYAEDGKWLILPYDYDTAIGINNEGNLKFGYWLEDIDHVNGTNVYSGQDSVLYVNIRLAFADEIKAMYKDLRTKDVFAYEEIERRFEEHQKVWGEAIFNEDARFKYIDPLVEDGDGSFLPMLQGSKAEQRKWWLYNRFRYLDSKYEAGDSMEDFITIRPSSKEDIVVTPYADIYAVAKFDSKFVRERALRGKSYALKNPLTSGNDPVVTIYSASQLSSLGDLSGLKPHWANFSKAIRLTSLKVGDGAVGYNNPNLTELTIGNLTLLKDLDVRNCSSLTQAADLSECTNIERVYYEGTAITGIKLPDGGILKTLHLPSTVKSLKIMNQQYLTDFSMPNYGGITTLRLEGVPSTVDSKAMLLALPNNARVRLIGFDWTVDSVDEIYALFDKLDRCKGVNERDEDTNDGKAVVKGTIRVDFVSDGDLEAFAARYKEVTIVYQRLGCVATFKVDGEVISRQVLEVGDTITVPPSPTKEATEQYTYSFAGWSTDGETVTDVPVIIGNKSLTFIAVFNTTLRSYTIRFFNGSALLQTLSVAYGTLPVYTGSEPTKESTDVTYKFSGWSPDVEIVTGNADYYAQFIEVQPLEQYSWAEISAISEAGTAANYFPVGARKAVTLNGQVGDDLTLNNYTCYVYILGIDHNKDLEGSGVTFGGFKTASVGGIDVALCGAKYDSNPTDGTKTFNVQHWGHSNYGGWAGCDMRYDILGSTDVQPSGYGANAASGRTGYNPSDTCTSNPVANTLMAALPADLRAVLKPITKYTDNVAGGSGHVEANVTATIDYLPLLAEYEISGSTYKANEYEKSKQARYAYFAAGNSSVKYKHSSTGSLAVWWERSPSYDVSYRFCLIDISGSKASNFPRDSNGLAPIFLV